MTVNISSYASAIGALKHPDLVQALYDAGRSVMADALITLHGPAHRRRRVVEFGVFQKNFFKTYEHDVFPAVLDRVLQPYLRRGGADLVELGYRITMNLTADFAGIDRRSDDAAETDLLLGLVKTFSEGATLVHSTRDPQVVSREVDLAMQQFDTEFFAPSRERRQRLIDASLIDEKRIDEKRIDASAANPPNDLPHDLPNDVLTTLLRNADKVELTDAMLRREIAFFLQAGAHSTANSTTDAMHELLAWCDTHPGDRERLQTDPEFLQRCVHESMRLHPASPVAVRRAQQSLELNGTSVAAGEEVIVDLLAANREVETFGADAERFNPHRSLAEGVLPFGLTFGAGTHACLGRDLDGGVVAKRDTKTMPAQLGIVPLLVQTLLGYGADRVPDDPPRRDPNTHRERWGYYPVDFTGERVA